MDNSMDNILDMYLFETNSLLEQLDELLIEAEKARDFTSEDVNEIFRIMHTIKGSSAMMQFSTIMTLAHHIEDLFFYIRENGIESLQESHKKELFDLMFKSTDFLRSEIEKVENNEPLDTNIDSFANEINSFLKKISGDDPGQDAPEEGAGEASSSSDSQKAAGASAEAGVSSSAPYVLKVFFDEGCGMENLRAFMLVNSLRDAELTFDFSPEDVETNPETVADIVENGFLLFFATREEAESAVPRIREINNIHSYEIMDPDPVLQPVKEDAETEQDSQPSSQTSDAPPQKPEAGVPKDNPPAVQQSGHSGNKQSLISVNLSKLDDLMALVGEIVITESMVTSSPDLRNLKLDNFNKSARQLRKLTDDLQDIAMSLRMVPVSGVFQKMNRIVRDMKQKLNKDTRLTIIGENTEVDKSIVDNIGDPIMHIVRNSMDHGIEDYVQERIDAGKKPQGEIVLSASHTGSEVIISVADDGRGIDPAAILAKAKKQGLLYKPENEYSQKEILNLLMAPGFSTNETVTEFSGRGVGMDVVKRNVEAVGGTVSISSELGKGTTTTLKIPLSMAIMDGMEIAVGKSIFTIPISNIRQSFKVQKEDVIYDTYGNEIIKCMEQFYPIIRIHSLYNIDTEITNIEDGILIWVEASDRSYCLLVDELRGEQQVVVKPLPPFLNNFNIKNSGISGCTILGDGNISLILDIINLYAVSHNQY